MREERFFYVPNAASNTELPEQEAQHAVRVLRLNPGDEIWLMDGIGNFYRAEVSMATKKRCLYNILEVMPQDKTWCGHIHLAIAPTKMMERMEWLAEKATEVGFDGITFIDCQFSERHVVRTDRIEKIIVSAMKQSRKPYMPLVNGGVMTKNGTVGFKYLVKADKSDHKFIAHCYNDQERTDLFDVLQSLPPDDSVSILVGPEGDFSVDEVSFAINSGYSPITLGNSRLRTETAGLVAVTMAQINKRRR